jgi:hypothetical protein
MSSCRQQETVVQDHANKFIETGLPRLEICWGSLALYRPGLGSVCREGAGSEIKIVLSCWRNVMIKKKSTLGFSSLLSDLIRLFHYLNVSVIDSAVKIFCEVLDVHSGVIDSAMTCTAGSLTPLWPAQRSHWLRCDMHSGVIDIWHRCGFWHHLCGALATFKGNIYRKNIQRPIVIHNTYNFHTQKMGVN